MDSELPHTRKHSFSNTISGDGHRLYSHLNRMACIIALQWLFTVCAVVLGVWVRMPVLGLAGLCIFGLGLVVPLRGSGAIHAWWQKWRLAVAWTGAVLVPCSLATAEFFTLDTYYALLAWTMGAAVLSAAYHAPGAPRNNSWKILALACGFTGSLVWLACAYLENLRGSFYFGLFVGVVLLVLCRKWFRLGAFGIQLVHTLILLLVGLPIVDFFFRPPQRFPMHPEVAEKYYEYEAARADPAAFARWWRFYMGEWRDLENDLFDRGVGGYPLRPRPNSHGTFFDSHISINSKGFRGREFSTKKNGVYRIVALGGSTTFGVTMAAADKPWPRLLAEMIKQRLKPARRVEVINAGVPTYSLGHTLQRMASDILPLKPDMIISYHGYNGFSMLYRAIPRAYGRAPPAYRLRPIKLLADCEYRFKLFCYRRRLMAGLIQKPPREADPMKSAYARAYKRLIAVARTNKIHLVLANFSMAVNEKSPRDVIQFYRVPFPAVFWQIKANAAHSLIVRELAREHPEVCFVDTHPHLDGEHDKFVDLIHLTQEGREQLAENMFRGIKDCLVQDLAANAEPTPRVEANRLQ